MKGELYTFRSTKHTHQFECLKLDLDFNPKGTYSITQDSLGRLHCSCFAAHRHTCRHREMLAVFANGLLDTGVFYEYDRRKWYAVDTDGHISEVEDTDSIADGVSRAKAPATDQSAQTD